jgi:DNA-binding MarR family transcriptional regulator
MDKPIGYWLKRLDQLIESAFGRVFAEQELSRRHWQVLNVLHPAPLDATALAEALRPFWEPGAITAADVIRDLTERGWVGLDDEGRYALTPAGLAGHAEVKAKVDAVRATVIDGLTEAEYYTTMRALQQMTANLEQAAAQAQSVA